MYTKNVDLGYNVISTISSQTVNFTASFSFVLLC